MAVIYENQHAALIDLVAAGEIGGLVNGYASIFLNGVALLDETKATATAKSGTATVSGTNQYGVPTSATASRTFSAGASRIYFDNNI